jgi:hypothetical protein
MSYSEKNKDFVPEYTSLSLAIDKLFERQEKDWGCFQVKKEGEFYSLFVPALPSFKFYQNPKSLIYRGYWQERELPNPTDTKRFPPDLWIKKKSQKVTIRQTVEKTKIDGVDREENLKENNRKLQLIDNRLKYKKVVEIEKKQRIYEIVYRHNPAIEIRVINKIIADFLKEKIKVNLVSVPEGEIFPLILVGNPE